MKKNILLFAISVFSLQAKSQKIANFQLSPKAANSYAMSYNAEIDLDKITYLNGSQFSLIEVSENVRHEVPFQI
ncbi:MAG: hypothetical protein ACI97P_002937, partial [Arcticibacterium sp.]